MVQNGGKGNVCLGCTQSPIQELLLHKSFYTERNKKLCALLQVFYIISGANKEGVCVHAGLGLCMHTHMYMRVG